MSTSNSSGKQPLRARTRLHPNPRLRAVTAATAVTGAMLAVLLVCGSASTKATGGPIARAAAEEATVRQYAIVVDGIPVARSEDPQTLFQLLDGIQAQYTDADTLSVAFAQEVSVEYLPVSETLENSPAAIRELLDPENPNSPYRLTVTTRSLVQEVATIPYETQIVWDNESYSNEQTLVQSGQTGSACATYLVTEENGVTVSSYTRDARVLSDPTPEIISRGTLPGMRTDSTGVYIWPTKGSISSSYGYRDISIGSRNHQGLDIANNLGTEVHAADGGTVFCAKESGGYGNVVKIQHDNGDITIYAHLSSICVQEGDRVYQGQLVGLMGSTGISTGSHLHFELRPGGGDAVNPIPYLKDEG